jgi:16S rRNA processing protein RimM
MDSPEQFELLKEVNLVKGDSEPRPMKIRRVWHHKGAVIVKFVGIDDMTAAESLRDAEVLANEACLPQLAEDQFYIDDLIGLDVVTTDGESLGKIMEVLQSPANDVYVTERAMIPAVKEFVLKIDFEKNKVVVRSVEGLVQG